MPLKVLFAPKSRAQGSGRVAGVALAGLALIGPALAACKDFDGGVQPEPPAVICADQNQGESLAARPDSTAVIVLASDLLGAVTASGELAWTHKFPADDSIAVYPRVTADSAVHVVTQKNLYALGATGATRYAHAHPFEPAPARKPDRMTIEPLPDSSILVSDGDQGLVKIDPAGAVKWRFVLPGRDSITSPPRAAADGSLFIRSRGYLYSLTPAGKQRWRMPLRQAVPSTR